MEEQESEQEQAQEYEQGWFFRTVCAVASQERWYDCREIYLRNATSATSIKEDGGLAGLAIISYA